MKTLIAVFLLAAGLLVIASQGTGFDPFKLHVPVYQPHTVTIGPVTYSASDCVQNCEWVRH